MSRLGERLLAVHDALDAAKLPHAIGGAIALGYYRLEPRGTRDLDLNVFVGRTRAKEVLAAMPSGVTVSGLALEGAEREGQVRLWWEEMPIDVFLSVLPFHDQAQREVRGVPFEGRQIPIVGPITLAVFKSLYDKPQHWTDVEAMVEQGSLDVDWAVAAIREIAGEGSPIAAKLAALAQP